jgi:hypothetical protein
MIFFFLFEIIGFYHNEMKYHQLNNSFRIGMRREKKKKRMSKEEGKKYT